VLGGKNFKPSHNKKNGNLLVFLQGGDPDYYYYYYYYYINSCLITCWVNNEVSNKRSSTT